MTDLEVINNIDIVEVADKLDITMVTKKERKYANCLWHDDKHPSMQVGGKHNMCHCYVCGKSCNVMGLIKLKTNWNFPDIVKWAKQNWPNNTEWLLEGDKNSKKGDKTTRRGERFATKGERKVCQVQKNAKDKVAYFDAQYVRNMISMRSSLVKCLLVRFEKAAVERVVYMYQLGEYCNRRHVDWTTFPIIDVQGRCHNLKAQHYDTNPESEGFGHCDKGCIMWLGSIMQREGKFPADGEFDNELLFGEHLLPKYPGMTVALVESPKNAVVCACAYPTLLWVAAGNKGMLKREVLEVLRGRKVLVFPDNDAIEEWSQKLEGMRDLANFQVVKDDLGMGEKGDIADAIFSAL